VKAPPPPFRTYEVTLTETYLVTGTTEDAVRVASLTGSYEGSAGSAYRGQLLKPLTRTLVEVLL